MTKFTPHGQETYRLGPVERWVAGVVSATVLGGLAYLIFMAVHDHDRLTTMEGLPAQIQKMQSDIAELSKYVYQHKDN